MAQFVNTVSDIGNLLWSSRAARSARIAVRRHPGASVMLGAGAVVGTGVAGALSAEAFRSSKRLLRSYESEQMARMILQAQSGPFGPSGQALGIIQDRAGTAGLTLAAHYAKNRNKQFGVLGLRFI